MTERIVLLVILMAFCVSGCSISKADADMLALQRLEEYCKKQSLRTSDFLRPEITRDEGRWLFDYTSNTTPKHFVRIYVENGGRTEFHSLVE